jgi:hypothetical protein
MLNPNHLLFHSLVNSNGMFLFGMLLKMVMLKLIVMVSLRIKEPWQLAEVWLEMLMVDSYLDLEGYIWANIVGF